MKIYNRYIIGLAIVLLLTTIIFTATGQDSLDIYFISYLIETLVITELYVFFNTKARRALNSVSVILFSGFLLMMLIKVINIVI